MALAKRKADRRSVGHVRSGQAEKERAKALGAEVVRGSGSGTIKGDVRKKSICRLEHKTTTKKSFSVTRQMVRKINAAALSSPDGEVPVMEIEFIDETGKKEMSVAVLPIYVLEMLGWIK